MDSERLPNGLTLAEEDQLVELLAKLNGKRMGIRVFDAMAKKTVTDALEAVCLRLNSRKEVEVYLTQRSPDGYFDARGGLFTAEFWDR